jgi:putative SOS response-associated peptidase YedK
MCSRYQLTPEAIRHPRLLRFAAEIERGLPPRGLATPSTVMPVLLGDDLEWMQWGLVPSWAEDPKIGRKLFNARCETAAVKPAFRDSFRSRRCLVPASGFIEWRRTPSGRPTPQLIRDRDGSPFFFAGLWSSWSGASGERIRSYTILTTSPNRYVREIHDRMPVILAEEAESRWLEGSLSSEELALPREDREMEIVPIELDLHRAADPAQQRLF